MKIIITERISEIGIRYLFDCGFYVDTAFSITRGKLLERIGEYDAVIIRSATKIDQELIGRGVRLKVVGRAGNGTDNIDMVACATKHIAVVNTPDSNAMSAAELTIALIFSVFRNIVPANKAIRTHDFRRKIHTGNQVCGKTAGIIGLGRIGKIVASRLKGCNMHVIAYDPYIGNHVFAENGVDKCDTLPELLVRSDLVTIHTPQNPETYGMIGENELKACKKGVRIFNTARGGLIDEKALYQALVTGQVAAAGIDVLDHEPSYELKEQIYQNRLIELENVLFTPHLGASTEEAEENVSEAIARLVETTLRKWHEH